MTATEVKALSDRELDREIAEKVMGWSPGVIAAGIVYPAPFSTDRNSAAQVLGRIKELNLVSQWCGVLLKGEWDKSDAFIWLVATAFSSPRLLMEAALLAREESK